MLLVLDNVKVPSPALVNAKGVEAPLDPHGKICPVIELAPALVMVSVPFPPRLPATVN